MKSLTVKAIGKGNIYISLWLGKYSMCIYYPVEVFHLMASQDINGYTLSKVVKLT